jgi:hypothetical protein
VKSTSELGKVISMETFCSQNQWWYSGVTPRGLAGAFFLFIDCLLCLLGVEAWIRIIGVLDCSWILWILGGFQFVLLILVTISLYSSGICKYIARNKWNLNSYQWIRSSIFKSCAAHLLLYVFVSLFTFGYSLLASNTTNNILNPNTMSLFIDYERFLIFAQILLGTAAIVGAATAQTNDLYTISATDIADRTFFVKSADFRYFDMPTIYAKMKNDDFKFLVFAGYEADTFKRIDIFEPFLVTGNKFFLFLFGNDCKVEIKDVFTLTMQLDFALKMTQGLKIKENNLLELTTIFSNHFKSEFKQAFCTRYCEIAGTESIDYMNGIFDPVSDYNQIRLDIQQLRHNHQPFSVQNNKPIMEYMNKKLQEVTTIRKLYREIGTGDVNCPFCQVFMNKIASSFDAACPGISNYLSINGCKIIGEIGYVKDYEDTVSGFNELLTWLDTVQTKDETTQTNMLEYLYKTVISNPAAQAGLENLTENCEKLLTLLNPNTNKAISNSEQENEQEDYDD